MAHNIEMKNGEASMMYVDEKPWHGLGTKLESPATAAQAIEAAKLDWEVTKVPLYAASGRRRLALENRFAVVRKDLLGKKQCKALGIVGSQYTPLQNREAFSFFDPIVGKKAAVYHTAGVLGDGERIWILAKLPEDIRVINDDITHKFLLLSNSHDGTSAVQVKFTPIRVVCQNTLTMALNKGPTVWVAHTQNIHERLREAERLLGIVKEGFAEIEKTFKAMVQVKMGADKLNEYLSLVFPDPADQTNERAAKKVLKNRGWAEHFFNQGKGNSARGVRSTLWAAYNGVTEFVDHGETRRTGPRRLNSVWFGDGYLIKARAYEAAKDRIVAWLN
ncbi:MAG: DUF932 domain-containing protein [Planctomycetes bacterium]|nr:DUF932 domain-containing protein [Planctomycetota bacterium]